MPVDLDTFPSTPTNVPSSASYYQQHPNVHLQTDHSLSFEMRASSSLTLTTAGFAFAPSPSVIYPVRPVNAPLAVAEVSAPIAVADVRAPKDAVVGSGVTISAAVIVEISKIAYSDGEYAKQALSSLKNDIARAECGRAHSCRRR